MQVTLAAVRASSSSAYRYPPVRGLELSRTEQLKELRALVKTLQNWEQARRKPTGPAKALFRIVEKQPAIAVRALMHRDAA